MRLIDADKLKDKIPEVSADIFENCVLCKLFDDVEIKYLIDAQPTIEAEPVKHGRWIKLFETENDITARCSECGMVYTLGKGRAPNYCGTCGARMDEPAPEAVEIINDGTYSAGEEDRDGIQKPD